jgi:hypothetical protein
MVRRSVARTWKLVSATLWVHVMPVNSAWRDPSPSVGRRPAAPLIGLSWRHFTVIVAVATSLAAIFAVILAPDLADRYARHAVKEFEREFGFEMGIITVADPTGTYATWGITAVTPGGRFEGLGIRAGDVPFDHHGHAATWLHGALREASQGRSAEIEVYNAGDVAAGANALRRIVITGIR